MNTSTRRRGWCRGGRYGTREVSVGVAVTLAAVRVVRVECRGVRGATRGERTDSVVVADAVSAEARWGVEVGPVCGGGARHKGGGGQTSGAGRSSPRGGLDPCGGLACGGPAGLRCSHAGGGTRGARSALA